jgi:hypothetical protein
MLLGNIAPLLLHLSVYHEPNSFIDISVCYDQQTMLNKMHQDRTKDSKSVEIEVLSIILLRFKLCLLFY